MTKPASQELKPGIHLDLSNEEYHGDTGSISKSGLDLISKCPSTYEYQYLQGNRPEPTSAMIVGAAAHMAVFEPEKFQRQYIEAPDCDRRTRAGKAEYEQFAAESEGKAILSAQDMAMVVGISKAVYDHFAAALMLERGEAEVSVLHHINDTPVKVRPDWMTDDLLVDLKTTTDASPRAFSKSCANFRYDVQAALYLDTVNAHFGAEIYKTFVFIAVEKTPPYQVAIYFADPDMVRRGREKYESDLATYRRCLETGIWPGYNHNQISPISLPAWA